MRSSRPVPTLFRWRRWVLACAAALVAAPVWADDVPTSADTASALATSAPLVDEDARTEALKRASDSVIGVRSIAIDGAKSADTLGAAREGSGVVIGADDLVLTIGYLIMEADQVQLLLDDGRELPARVIAYDQATGFGLVQSLAPLRIAPAPLGDASAMSSEDPLMVVSGGADGAISMARLVSHRSFSAYWEYHIDGALFTAPARTDQSGAALFNARGELLGIGSLLVSDAMGGGEASPHFPGNMFVPVDLLKPILTELRVRGESAQSKRAWMGVNCIEQDGAVQVMRVSSDSPAELAGLQAGDRIVRLDGRDVGALDTLWRLLWDGGKPDRVVTLDIRRGNESRQLKMNTVDRMTTLKHAEGI